MAVRLCTEQIRPADGVENTTLLIKNLNFQSIDGGWHMNDMAGGWFGLLVLPQPNGFFD